MTNFVLFFFELREKKMLMLFLVLVFFASSSSLNQPYGISQPHGVSRRFLNHVLKHINQSSYEESTIHQNPSSSSSKTPSIRYETIGRYFCGTAETHWNDCWYSNRFYVNGKLFTVSNPKNHFSVLEPSGGCGVSAKVSTTARDFGNQTFHGGKPGCRVAVNAGFFTRDVEVLLNATTNATAKVLCGTRSDAPCDCLGNLISHQKVVQSTSLQNVNFGLRDGAFVVGYLTEKEVNSKTHPFDQLISGVIWMVRNGTNYVDIAASIENPTTQQTSEVLEDPNNHRANTFVDVFAARTILGHDIEGRLKIFQLDGLHGRDRPTRGIDLRSLANILIDLGFHNAINLDGGGSSTTVQEDSLTSFPSDQCTDVTPIDSLRCERPVSSIICIHDVIEQDPNPNPNSNSNSNSNFPLPTPTSSPTPTSTPIPTPPIPISTSPTAAIVPSSNVAGTTFLSILLCLSLSIHLGLFYFIGIQKIDLREICHSPFICCKETFSNICKTQRQYSEIEKQGLKEEEIEIEIT